MVLHHLHQIRPLLLLHRAAARRVATVIAATGDVSQRLSRLTTNDAHAPHATAPVRRAIRGCGYGMPSTKPLDSLMVADEIAMCISNQKSGTRGETIYHHSLPGRKRQPGG